MAERNFAEKHYGPAQGYLNAGELKVWKGAKQDVINAERRLRILGKVLLGGEYGGR